MTEAIRMTCGINQQNERRGKSTYNSSHIQWSGDAEKDRTIKDRIE